MIGKIGRRRFLRGAGICLALPLLESFSNTQNIKSNTISNAPAKRFVCIGTNLGFYRPAFYPKNSGFNYKASQLLKHTDSHRNDYTVFSGLDHRSLNGHSHWDNFLCGNIKGKISLDQVIAEQIGQTTKIPSMQLCAGGIPSIQKVNYNRHGVPLPLINRPSVIYKKMFTSPEERTRIDYLLSSGQSSLDIVLDETKTLARKVSKNDRQKLQEYYNSLREVEKRMVRQRAHLKKKPVQVDYQLPDYDPVAPSLMFEAQRLMYDLMALALQTDSTRVISLFIAGLGQVFTIDGVTLQAGYHALSHHGTDPDMIKDLLKVESENMKCFNRFLDQLKEKKDENGQSLLDTTIVLLGTGMGDASTHNNSDLPTLVAGGSLKHGRHIKIDRKASQSHLLGDLYIALLQQIGIEADSFANAHRKMEI